MKPDKEKEKKKKRQKIDTTQKHKGLCHFTLSCTPAQVQMMSIVYGYFSRFIS